MVDEITHGMSNREYHELPGMSRSRLKLLSHSVAKFLYPGENKKVTAALELGRVVHAGILEPARFESEYAVKPKLDMRYKINKQAMAEWVASNKEEKFISEKNLEMVLNMRGAVSECKDAARIIKSASHFESSIFFEYQGVEFKSRPDIICKEAGIVADYKTTLSVRERAFTRATMNYGYDLQLVLQIEACKAIYDRDFIGCWIAQEKNPPFVARVFRPDQSYIDMAYDRADKLIDKYLSYKRENFRGTDGRLIDDTIRTITAPLWA